MAKVIFTAELSFEVDDASKMTGQKAFELLRVGMSPWSPVWAPHVTVDIKHGSIDGHEFAAQE